MKTQRLFLPFAALALAGVAGCAAGVRYDDGYGYGGGYASGGYAAGGYADGGYADGGYAEGVATYDTAGPPVVEAPGELVVLPGTDIYAAPSVSAGLYFADGYWWRPWNNHWYRSRHYGSGWALVSTPYFYSSIPLGWHNDYYHSRWRGRPYHYHHVSRDEAVTRWDRWKRDRYWRDDRWASDRDRYRRDSTDRRDDRYSDGRRDDDRRYGDGRRDDGRYDDRRETVTTDERYQRDREYLDGRRQIQREASSPRQTSPSGSYESRTTYNERREPARTVDRDGREYRPTSRSRVVEERRNAPAVRSTRPQPTSTVDRDRRSPATRSQTEQRRVTTPTRQMEQRRVTTPTRQTEQRRVTTPTRQTEQRRVTTPTRQSEQRRVTPTRQSEHRRATPARQPERSRRPSTTDERLDNRERPVESQF